MKILSDEKILYYHSGEHFADAVAMDNACGPRIPHLSEKEREFCVVGRNIAKAQLEQVRELLDGMVNPYPKPEVINGIMEIRPIHGHYGTYNEAIQAMQALLEVEDGQGRTKAD